MKKTLMLVLVMALAFSCFAAVLTAGASTEIVQGTKQEGRNYFKDNAKMVIGALDFENGAGEFYQNWSNVTIADGVATIKTVAPAYPMRAAYSGFRGIYNVGKTYYFQLDLKFNDKVNAIDLQIWDTSACKMDAAFKIVRDGDSVSFELVENPAKDISGYNATKVTQNLKYSQLDNGFYRVYFEMVPNVDVTESTAVYYGIQGSTSETAQEGEVVFDNIEHGYYDAPKYFTIDYDADFDNTTASPLNSVAEEYVEDYIDSSKAWVVNVGDESAIEDQRGKFTNAADATNKLVKKAGLVYFQYDIAVQADTAAIFTLDGLWSEVNYDGNSNTWSSAGLVKGFSAVETEFGYRLSYFIDFTDHENNDVYIKTKGVGFVAIDNLVVAHEDYSAYLKSTAMYHYVGTADVSLDFDAKGKEVTSVKLDDDVLTADDYTIADGKLTIKAGKIATTELGKNYTLSVVTTGSETPVTATISQIDNRPEVTASYNGEALEAVTYNGTTNYDGTITLTLTGVADGDVVTVSGTAALASKNAGATKVVITNLVLAGADAYKYRLTTEKVEIDITVNALQLTIGQATVADKTYDGTTTANVTAGTLVGVLEGDNVTVTASGVFDSKDVASATKVTVTYTIAGDDAANYIAPVASEVAKTISKANATVTAKAATKQEGAADPELKYDVTGLVEGDALTGALARDKGESAGEYNITIGTLANSNYEITFTGAKLTITAKPAEDKPAEDKGCFGVVGAASVAVFAVAVAAVAVVCKRKED